MKFKALVISLLLFCSTLALALVPQGAAPKGRIEGFIFKAGTKDPLVGVRVNVGRNTTVTASSPARGGATEPSLPSIPPVVTDRDGRFVVPDLEPGSYRVFATAPGYVRQAYGQRVFPGQGTVLTLADGQVMKDLVMDLILTGNVSGRIRDNFGQLASGVPVQLLKSAYSADGQKTFQAAGSTRTNDRGEYRIYWITPGRYMLAAGSPSGPAGAIGGAGGGGQPATPNDPGENYEFSFFPGVSDPSAANSIEVTSGNELSADFLVSQQQVYTIRGRAIDATTNQPPASLRTSMLFANLTGGNALWSMSAGYTPATGAFQINNIVPGTYVLQVASPTTSERMPLDVTGNIENLTLVLNGAVSLPGRISIEGLDQSGLDRFRVQLRPLNPMLTGNSSSAPGNDGAFKIENFAPGDYYVGVTGSQDYFVKAARFDRDDVLNKPLKISGSIPGGATLDVVVSPKVGQVSGVVTDAKLQPVIGVQAVLIPDKNRDRVELFRAVTTDQAGRFTINGVVPGDYKLFSWESLKNYGYFDTDLVKKSEPQGKIVHVGESSKQQLDVKVIPASK